MKSKDLQPELLYPEKLSFRMEGHMKSFPEKKKLKEFIIIKPLLHEMLKGLFKEKDDQNYTPRVEFEETETNFLPSLSPPSLA